MTEEEKGMFLDNFRNLDQEEMEDIDSEDQTLYKLLEDDAEEMEMREAEAEGMEMTEAFVMNTLNDADDELIEQSRNRLKRMSTETKQRLMIEFRKMGVNEMYNLDEEEMVMFSVLYEESISNIEAMELEERSAYEAAVLASKASELARQAAQQQLWTHVGSHGLVSRAATPADGNCWLHAITDQILLHDLPGVPRDHLELRRAVVAAIPSMERYAEWRDSVLPAVEEDTLEPQERMDRFVARHSRPGEWTDAAGIMVAATALFLGRQVKIFGSANIRPEGPGFTLIESTPGSGALEPLTVCYWQEVHYQSLCWADGREGKVAREALLAEGTKEEEMEARHDELKVLLTEKTREEELELEETSIL
jgi:hypothetical protein